MNTWHKKVVLCAFLVISCNLFGVQSEDSFSDCSSASSSVVEGSLVSSQCSKLELASCKSVKTVSEYRADNGITKLFDIAVETNDIPSMLSFFKQYKKELPWDLLLEKISLAKTTGMVGTLVKNYKTSKKKEVCEKSLVNISKAFIEEYSLFGSFSNVHFEKIKYLLDHGVKINDFSFLYDCINEGLRHNIATYFCFYFLEVMGISSKALLKDLKKRIVRKEKFNKLREKGYSLEFEGDKKKSPLADLSKNITLLVLGKDFSIQDSNEIRFINDSFSVCCNYPKHSHLLCNKVPKRFAHLGLLTPRALYKKKQKKAFLI